MANILKLRTFLLILRFISKYLPHNVSNWLSVFITRYIGFDQEEKKIVCQPITLDMGAEVNEGTTWQSYLKHKGVAQNKAFHLQNLDKKWLIDHVEVIGHQYIQALMMPETGTLVMTYHHHYNLLFCILFGLMGHCTSVLAMDPKLSPLYKHFSKLSDQIYGGVEKHLLGGSILYVAPNKTSSRSLIRAFDNKHIVISANDFPYSFATKRKRDFPFFGKTINCPTGSVELALKKRVPIVTAFLSWSGGDNFKLTIQPVNTSSVETVFKDYLEHLESIISTDPGLWEGWKWL